MKMSEYDIETCMSDQGKSDATIAGELRRGAQGHQLASSHGGRDARLVENEKWDLVDAPIGVTPIICRWVYKVKYNTNGSVNR